MKFILFLLFVLTPFFLFQLLGVPFAKPLGLVTTVLFLWITEIIPVAVTGMCVPCLVIIFGILSPAAAFAPFGNGILGLFVGAFLLVRGCQKYGLDERMARSIMCSRYASQSLAHLIRLFTFSAWFLGMWMSNTATCAVLLPICTGILGQMRSSLEDKAFQRFSNRLLLTCAFTPSIGGMMTPVGSVPNALAVQYLSGRGIHLGFVEWMVFAFPVSVTLLIAAFCILQLIFPLKRSETLCPLPSESIPIRHAGHHKALIGVFIFVIVMWLTPEIIQGLLPESEFAEMVMDRFPIALSALLGASSLFLIEVNGKPLLDRGDITKIDWGTILLFGGGLCLGKALEESGFASTIATLLLKHPLGQTNWLPVSIAAGSALLSEISSNTVTASILVPIIGDFTRVMPSREASMLLLGGIFASGLGFMLPISTPPNALVFGTGRLRLRDMALAGVLIDVVGILIVGGYIMLRVALL